MKYFHIIKESRRLEDGFNFYPLNDPCSFGFIFRYGKKMPIVNLGSKAFWFRYSKNAKKWIFGNKFA